jgi:uncharacterized membrane protein
LAETGQVPGRSSKLDWIWAQITGRLWFRVSLYGVAAVVTALLASVMAPLVPQNVIGTVREDATWEVLAIIASSMLVVATFSLGAMVTALTAAAQQATPRAVQVLIDDPVAQNVISTFLGAFVFAVVGLFALSFGYYSPAGETVLLLAAGAIIVLVIATLFGWLDHLTELVRLAETISKITERTEAVLRARALAPNLGGMPPGPTEARGHPVRTDEVRYVRHVDIGRLQKIATEADGRIFVACQPGALAHPGAPLALTSWTPDDDAEEAIRKAFTLGPERSFDQDPRYCLEVLAEIGSRALSPGINDPGTAFAILAGQQRLLTVWSQACAEASQDGDGAGDTEVSDRVSAPGLEADDLFEDAFAPLAQDGAGRVEVALRLQHALAALSALETPGFAEAAGRVSRRGLALAHHALVLDTDRGRIDQAAAAVGGA